MFPHVGATMPQQHRARVTREAIVLAAAREFARLGFGATSLNVILERSRVTKGAFYFHFPSKEALAQHLIDYSRRGWAEIERHRLRGASDPLQTVVLMVDDYARLLTEDELAWAGIRLLGEDGGPGDLFGAWYVSWEGLLSRLLADAARRGLLRPGVEPVDLAGVIAAGVVGARAVSHGTSGSGELAERVTRLWRVVLPGVATEGWWNEFQGRNPALVGA